MDRMINLPLIGRVDGLGFGIFCTMVLIWLFLYVKNSRK